VTPTPVAPDGSQEFPVLLESDLPLSQSRIWQRQRDFYRRQGIAAWSVERVPNFITNNPFFADTYARIICGFLRDCQALEMASGSPLRILELGAGAGKFSYLFLRRLCALLREQGLPHDIVRYCMTDCAEAVIDAWKRNPYLGELSRTGMLQFELLDASTIGDSKFLHNTPPDAPMVVIANYVFDTLPQDAFEVRDGMICEMEVETRAPSPTGAHTELAGLRFSYKSVPMPPDRYAEGVWNRIADSYRDLPGTSFLFPTAALSALRQIDRAITGPMLLLVADKGYCYDDVLRLSQGPPVFEFHARDCFSLMVNFDAIAKYFQAEGGQALLPDKRYSGLNICGFLKSHRTDAFPATHRAYGDLQSAFGVEDLFTLLAWLNAHMEEMSVPQILSVLRLTRWDTVAFMRLFPVLGRMLRHVSAERRDIHTAVMRTWDNHFPIASHDNEIAFQCGVVLLELRYFEDALRMFETSQTILGPSATTSYNIGLCLLGLNRSVDALKFMTEACNLDPSFEPALRSREKLEDQRIDSR
jgi:hypothetical protein